MKRGKQISIKINFSNRWLYTFIFLGILIVAGSIVYATTYSASSAGHPYTEITTCGANQILKMVNGAWACSSDVDTNTWPTQAAAVYEVNKYCDVEIAGKLQTIPMGANDFCLTRICGYGGLKPYYYQCGGSCAHEYYNEKPWKCGTTRVGYLVTGY